MILLFLISFATSILAFLLPNIKNQNKKLLAILFSLFPLLLLLSQHNHWTGSKIDYNWIPPLGIHFHLQIDSLSLLFLYLTAIIIPISLLAVRSSKLAHPNTFYGLVLLLEGLLIGFFTAHDLFLFTIFWEAMLLPLYFIINLWGGPQRYYAALKFLIYMITGSALMVFAVIALFFTSGGSLDLDSLTQTASSAPYSVWLFTIFMLAFAVKTPLFPFHGWLPDAYYQAPTAGTILLSAILSKAGVYGILRIGMELFAPFMKTWGPLLLGLAFAGVFYGAFCAWAQKDFKRLIAYSSFSHVNFVLVGLFVWNTNAHGGAILQAINHGITISALFLVSGWLEERLGSTSLSEGRGLAAYMPVLCWVTFVFVLSSVALPGMNNFVGEVLIFFGLFQSNHWLTALLGISIILSVVYMLRWMQKMYFDSPSPFQERWTDLKTKEILIALPLILLILWIGIYPSPVLKEVKPAAEKTIAIVGTK